MNKVETFKTLRQDFQDLTYENHKNKEKLSIRFTMLIGKVLGNGSVYIEKFNIVNRQMFHSGASDGGHPKFKESWNVCHESALKIIDDVIEDIEILASIDGKITTEQFEINRTKVFIVHGHDDGAKNETARFVERLGFEAVILHEQVDSGATIIEKLGKHTDVGFAIVLYTECDIGGVIKSKPEEMKPRARQNVIFEHGLLIGKIGRANVVALVKGNVEFPNDISGVVYKTMDTGGAWKYSIAREMKISGYDVDLNKIN